MSVLLSKVPVTKQGMILPKFTLEKQYQSSFLTSIGKGLFAGVWGPSTPVKGHSCKAPSLPWPHMVKVVSHSMW